LVQNNHTHQHATVHSNLHTHYNQCTAAGISCKSIRTHRLLWKWNWNKLLVIFAPLCPLNTNIDSLATATGKLQHVGGHSPSCTTSSQDLESPCITMSNNMCDNRQSGSNVCRLHLCIRSLHNATQHHIPDTLIFATLTISNFMENHSV